MQAVQDSGDAFLTGGRNDVYERACVRRLSDRGQHCVCACFGEMQVGTLQSFLVRTHIFFIVAARGA